MPPPSEFRLTIPRIEVTLDDGSTFVVQAMNPDLIRWDRMAVKHGWPGATSAPFLWMTFIAWSAAKRTGAIPADLTWETFGDERCVQVRNLTEELEPSDGVNPTQLEAVPG
jgi:hypothetical protein